MPEKHPAGKQHGLTPGPEDSEKLAWGQTLRVARVLAGLSQQDVTDRTGIDKGALSKYEGGQQVPTEPTNARISAGVGIPLTVLRAVLLPAVRISRGALWGFRTTHDIAGLADAVLASLLGPLRLLLRELVELLEARAKGPWRGPEKPSPADRAEAPVLLRVMLEASPAERQLLLAETREFRSWALCELMCAESLKAAPDSAKRALELAELAVAVAQLCPGEEGWRRRIRGLAGVHLGNAQRVDGKLPKAGATVAEALEHWDAGAQADPGLLDEAHVLSLVASLRIEQRRLDEALLLVDQALAADDGALRANLLVKRARAHEQLGDFTGAVSTLEEATPFAEAHQDPRLRWVVRFNLLGNLCHLGRFEEAATLLPGVQALAAQLGNELDLVRTRGLTGWTAAGQGRREEALELLEGVRAEFAAKEIAYDAALVTLELAVLYLEDDRTAEVKTLAVELTWVFAAQGVHREALAALNLFCEAAQREALSLVTARRMSAYLYRARENPELSFEKAE